MILVQRLLYLMVVVLSVTCVVAGEAQQQEPEVAEVTRGDSDLAGGAGAIRGGVDDTCKTEPPTSDCPRIPSEPVVPRAECVGSPEKKGCTTTTLKPKDTCPDDSEPSCLPKTTQEMGSGEDHRNTDSEPPAPTGPGVPADAGDSVSNEAHEGNADAGADVDHGEKKLPETQPGKVPEAADESPAVSVSEEGTGNGEQSTT
ncbi:uncharacterized protein TM35_001281020, partial [Trypanosoma theileri]